MRIKKLFAKLTRRKDILVAFQQAQCVPELRQLRGHRGRFHPGRFLLVKVCKLLERNTILGEVDNFDCGVDVATNGNQTFSP